MRKDHGGRHSDSHRSGLVYKLKKHAEARPQAPRTRSRSAKGG